MPGTPRDVFLFLAAWNQSITDSFSWHWHFSLFFFHWQWKAQMLNKLCDQLLWWFGGIISVLHLWYSGKDDPFLTARVLKYRNTHRRPCPIEPFCCGTFPMWVQKQLSSAANSARCGLDARLGPCVLHGVLRSNTSPPHYRPDGSFCSGRTLEF